MQEFTMKMPQAKAGATVCASLRSRNASEEAAYATMYNENAPDQGLDNPTAQTLCQPALSKCTRILHKGTSRENLQQMCRVPERTLI